MDPESYTLSKPRPLDHGVQIASFLRSSEKRGLLIPLFPEFPWHPSIEPGSLSSVGVSSSLPCVYLSLPRFAIGDLIGWATTGKGFAFSQVMAIANGHISNACFFQMKQHEIHVRSQLTIPLRSKANPHPVVVIPIKRTNCFRTKGRRGEFRYKLVVSLWLT